MRFTYRRMGVVLKLEGKLHIVSDIGVVSIFIININSNRVFIVIVMQ